jgi:predicted MFS family arabinose efflux permease
VAVVGAGIALATSNIWLTFAGMLIAGFGGAFVFPAMMTLVGTVPGVAPETGIGTVSTVARVGFLVSPLMAGAVAESYGVPATFWIAVAGGLITIGWATSVSRRPVP